MITSDHDCCLACNKTYNMSELNMHQSESYFTTREILRNYHFY